MKHYFKPLLLILISGSLNAQTGIGTTTPDASAKLEVSATNKGFLPPRVTLTSGTDNTTIPNPATGLLVYNTGANAGLLAGYYYWNGSSWATIATASGSGVSASILRGSRSTAQTGLTNGGNVIFTQVDNTAGQEMSLNTSTGQIILSAGRTYRLLAQVPNYQTSSGDTRLQLAWYNETTGAYIGSSANSYPPVSGASYGSTGGLSEAVITTTTTTIVSYRIVQLSNTTQLGGSVDFNTTGSYPWFEAQVISGNTPVNGQSVDYVSVTRTTNQTVNAGDNVLFNSIIAGNIPYNTSTGEFSLSAGKTYRLSCVAGLANTNAAAREVSLVWRTAAGTNLNNTTYLLSASYNTGASSNNGSEVYYTPATNTTVVLYVSYAPSAPILASNLVFASIQQIGSSAIVNPWVLSGNDVYNTSGKIGIGTTTPTQALDVTGNVNVTGRINLTDPSGNVTTKVAAWVDAGVYVTLDNIKATVPTTGNRGISIATVSGSVNMYYSGIYLNGGLSGSRTASPGSFTTSDSGSLFGWTFGSSGDTVIYQLMDPTNNRAYRITLVIMPSYIKNFISIERLL